jgi:polysaccharide biosynthesis transport protein
MVAYLEYRDSPPAEPARVQARPFHEMVLALRRQQWLIAAFVFVGFVAGAGVLLTVAPRYTAESSILLDPRKPEVTELPGFSSEQKAPEVAEVRSEVEVLLSENHIRRVVAHLDLTKHADFLGEPPAYSELVAWVKETIATAVPWLAEAVPVLRRRPGGDGQQDPLIAATEKYRSNLTVTNDGRSYVIRIGYTSHDPELAAAIVNAHLQLYIADQVGSKRQIGEKAAAWLKRELELLEVKLASSEAAAQQFREDNQIILSGGTTLLSQQLAAVNAQIPVAAAERENQESRLQHARALLRKGQFESESAVLESTVMQNLRQHEATLVRRMAEMRAIYDERHPAVLKLEAEMRDVRGEMAAGLGRIINQIGNEVEVARTREKELRTRLFELEKRSLAAARAETKLREFEREISANRSLVDVLLTRYKQVGVQGEIQQADARILTTALVPINPTFPKLRLHMPLVLFGSLLLGTLFALLREVMQRGFKGSHEIEAECELPSLGSVPVVPAAWWKDGAPQDLVVDRAQSSFAEAIRYIRNSIQSSSASEEPPKALLVTSSLPHEGKSVLAVSLARSFAEAGQRTLLIDCDLRSPSVQKMLGAARDPDRPDLGTVLTGNAHWLDAVQKDPKSALTFIASEPSARPRHDLLACRPMSRLIEQARQHYDIVIFDTPPITAVSDTLVLARYVDATMLAVRWGATPRDIAKTSLNKLFQSGAHLCGVVLTRVDLRRGVFSPAEVEYYHSRNRQYYAE